MRPIRYLQHTAVASLLGLGLVAAAHPAHASCDAATLSCSTGTAALHAESRDKLVTSLDTGWYPACSGSDHCTSKPIQFRADLALDPVAAVSQPVWLVDMPTGAVVDATWDSQYFTFGVDSSAQSGGTFKVHHSLTPSVSLYVGAFGLSYTYNLDAVQLVNRLPGASFNYDASGSAQFAPWAFGGVHATVNAPSLDASRLFEIDLAGLPAIGQDLDGTLAVNAVTSPTFAYKTTRVTLVGTDAPITAVGGSTRLPVADGDFLEVQAAVEGEITAEGSVDIVPYVHLTRILDHDNLDMELGVNTGLHVKYEVPAQKVTFPAQTIHVALPNVHVPKVLDVGNVGAGSSTSRTITIQNSGELGASLSFTSSDPQFSVPAGAATTGPKSSYDLKVDFHPDADGPAIAQVTVHSNDPDSPDQILTVTANGAKAPGETGDGSDGLGNPQAGGCGCKAAGEGGSGRAPAGVFAVALVALAVAGRSFRRRRT